MKKKIVKTLVPIILLSTIGSMNSCTKRRINPNVLNFNNMYTYSISNKKHNSPINLNQIKKRQITNKNNLEDILSQGDSIEDYISQIHLKDKSGKRFNVNLSKSFIPHYLSKSRNAHRYFINAPISRLESLGLLYDYNPRQLLLYSSIEDTNIDLKDVLSKKLLIKPNMKITPNNQNAIKQIRRKLQHEGFLVTDDNTKTLISKKFTTAIKKYQKFHNLSPDGVVGQNTALKMTKSYDELAQEEFKKFKNFLSDRVFHSTNVLNPNDLNSIVDDIIDDLNIDNPERLSHYLTSKSKNINANIKIPENYSVDGMDLSINVIKDKNNKSRGTLSLNQNYKGKIINLLETRVVMGGRNYDNQIKGYRNFPTPNGTFNVKDAIVNPLWIPTKSIKKASEISKLAGPYSAFGLYKLPLLNLHGEYGGYAIHTTSTTQPFYNNTGSSHGCVRLNPIIANHLIPFILYYNASNKIIESKIRGTIIPLTEKIKVRIK